MAKTYTSRPSGDDNNRTTDKSEKTYRATLVGLSMGGQSAKTNQYIGVAFVPMRIYPAVSTAGGIRHTHILNGFDPETGEWLSIFADTKLRDDGTGIVKNFGGGIMETLGTRATQEEVDAIMDEVNAEQGTDYVYNAEDWVGAGGFYKLRESAKGKPIIVGKRMIQLKNSTTRMNIFQMDTLNPADFPQLDEFRENFNVLRGIEYDPEVEGANPSSNESYDNQEGSGSEEEAIPEPEPVKKKVRDDSQSSTKRRVVTRETPTQRANAVAQEFNSPASTTQVVDGRDIVTLPESVAAFIKESYDNRMSTDQVVLGLIQDFELKSSQAVGYVEEWLDRRGQTKPMSQPTRVTAKPNQPKESELIQAARKCKADGMDVPATFDALNQKFPKISRDEKRAAIKEVGLIRI